MKRILFPVVQDVSNLLAPMVVKLASSLDAQIHVLHVAQPSDAFLESRMITAKDWMKTFAQNHLKEVSVHIAEVIPGDPAEEILKYAENNDMDLIIMGTHGRKGIDRFYFGHVAENVVAQSTVPVLSVNLHKAKKFILDFK